MEKNAKPHWNYVQCAPEFRNKRLGLDKWKTCKKPHQVWLFLNKKMPFKVARGLDFSNAVFKKALNNKVITQAEFDSLGIIKTKKCYKKKDSAGVKINPEYKNLTAHQKSVIEFAHKVHEKLDALKEQPIDGPVNLEELSGEDFKSILERHRKKNAPIVVR